jgi:hypothetical protein
MENGVAPSCDIEIKQEDINSAVEDGADKRKHIDDQLYKDDHNGCNIIQDFPISNDESNNSRTFAVNYGSYILQKTPESSYSNEDNHDYTLNYDILSPTSKPYALFQTRSQNKNCTNDGPYNDLIHQIEKESNHCTQLLSGRVIWCKLSNGSNIWYAIAITKFIILFPVQ